MHAGEKDGRCDPGDDAVAVLLQGLEDHPSEEYFLGQGGQNHAHYRHEKKLESLVFLNGRFYGLDGHLLFMWYLIQGENPVDPDGHHGQKEGARQTHHGSQTHRLPHIVVQPEHGRPVTFVKTDEVVCEEEAETMEDE